LGDRVPPFAVKVFWPPSDARSALPAEPLWATRSPSARASSIEAQHIGHTHGDGMLVGDAKGEKLVGYLDGDVGRAHVAISPVVPCVAVHIGRGVGDPVFAVGQADVKETGSLHAFIPLHPLAPIGH